MGSSDHLLTSIEICAGAGGQAIGLHKALFKHLALVEIDEHACSTLEENAVKRQAWPDCQVVKMDVKDFVGSEQLAGLPVGNEENGKKKGELDLLAGGVPCPPFSHAGKQLGKDDERDLFPVMLDLVKHLKPKAVMIENVRGIRDSKFDGYRADVVKKLEDLKYVKCEWDVLEAHHFGVPQLRPRAILVAIRQDVLERAESRGVKFVWPTPTVTAPVTAAAALETSMGRRLELLKKSFPEYSLQADEAFAHWWNKSYRGGVAPTLVGGSKKHGGADLGPSRAKAAWKSLGINGLGVANVMEECLPERDFLTDSGPMLTVSQAAIIQGFDEEWEFSGGKTAQYRQVGNAFPPPVAEAVGRAISDVLRAAEPGFSDRVECDEERIPSARFAVDSELVPATADSNGDRERAFVG
ncbi:DNA cytosine methyltransferase [Streptomyces sp. H27-D2]|uniref:DNA cytosine methyltransferase n=1 Tax=Streptomyces sp. H27-D2 TaxID=3046304 RepID=UPI002DBD5319|nr:DNA (cytosine-5-)-methyltransferase [Streptomyces sp. H27-D2]MEC4018123.1 DNA (cytosine-5-)-methyltransferase [Streptomyces sp. H27-D2]